MHNPHHAFDETLSGREPMPKFHGLVWWSELMTRDVPAAVAYYKSICGWEFDEMSTADGGKYHVGKQDGRPVTGIMDMTSMKHLDGIPAHWFTYIAVADVNAAAAKTKTGGGEVLREPFDVPGVGQIAIVKDPGDAAVGLITPSVPEMDGPAKA